jgi:site-specific DNA-cytosine methylase
LRGGGGLEPKIVIYDDYNANIAQDQNVIGTIRPNFSRSAFRNGFKIIETMAKETNINLPEELKGKKFRIRKLTPTECLRLMGCDEETICTMTHCGLSNSALYKLAGNSIVVDVLYHIFRKMFIETEMDIEKGKPIQLELF